MAHSPSAGGGQPLVVSLNCLDDPSLEQEGLAGVAAVEHVPLSAVASGRVEAATAVLLPSLAFLPRAAQRRLRPWQLLLCLGSADRAADAAVAADLGLRLVHVDANRAEEVADTVMALILGLLRRTHLLSRQASSAPAVVAAGWLGSVQPLCRGMRRCRGLVLGIIGRSAAARCLATRSLAFRMSVLYFDPRYTINDPYQFPSQPELDRDVGKHRAPDACMLIRIGEVKGGHSYAVISSRGRLLIKASEILTKLSEIAGFTPCEEIELPEARVKLTFASIPGKYNQELTIGVLYSRLQLCKYYCRSNSSSKKLGFALMEACNIYGIQSIAFSSCLPNKFLIDGHALPPLMETAIGKFPELPELPREILMDIFALLEVPDLVRAGSVCTSWNSAYTSICSIGLYKQQQTPYLFYTSQSDDDNVARLYSLAEKKAYKLTVPEPPIHRRHLIGSSNGWLVTADERSEMHLVNPITCEQITLPSVITIEHVVKPVYDDGGAICKYHYSMYTAGLVTNQRTLTLTPGKLRCYLHHKAFVFYDASAESYFVVLIHNPFGQLAFARLGDEKWTQLSSHIHIHDCIYKDGLLYAVTAFGEIVAFNLSGTVVTTKIIMDRMYDCRGFARVYIVQAPWGDLLQVWRPEQWMHEDLNEHHHETFGNKIGNMIIYKVCTVAKELVQINSLDGHILFLGNNQSLCCRAEEYPQLKPDHVYFTDDSELMAFAIELGFRVNIGVLDFKSKRVEEIIFPWPWSNCRTPLLIIPNPRKMDSLSYI